MQQIKNNDPGVSQSEWALNGRGFFLVYNSVAIISCLFKNVFGWLPWALAVACRMFPASCGISLAWGLSHSDSRGIVVPRAGIEPACPAGQADAWPLGHQEVLSVVLP